MRPVTVNNLRFYRHVLTFKAVDRRGACLNTRTSKALYEEIIILGAFSKTHSMSQSPSDSDRAKRAKQVARGKIDVGACDRRWSGMGDTATAEQSRDTTH